MTTFKKIIIVLFLLINHAQAQVASALIPSPPELSASSYLLIDANSGKIIIEHNPDKRLPPASLTKIMTSYIAANEIDRLATVGASVSTNERPSSTLDFLGTIMFEPGSILSPENKLKIPSLLVILKSGVMT